MALPIGGFMPIPLAMMIPFMATQSMVMGDAFGRAFQYGKRKISAMSNEEFNATSIEQQAANMFESYKLIIPKLNDAIDDSSALQRKIISEMLLILPKFISETGTEIFSPGGTNIKTEIEDHPHTSTRPHIHSNGPPTITGKTISNGITTTHYSDGTTTTSGTSTIAPPPTPKPVSLYTPEQKAKLVAHYENNIQVLALKINQFKIKDRNATTSAAKKTYKSQIKSLTRELNQQTIYLNNVKSGKNPY